MAKNNLTDKQSHTFALIMEDIERGYGNVHYHFTISRDGVIRPRSGASALVATLRGLQRAGWITLLSEEPKQVAFTLTDDGKAEVKTPAGLAAIAPTSAAPEAAREDAPAMELCRTPPLYMELANMNGGLVGAQQLEIEELRQEVAKLLKSEQEDEYIDEPILSKPLYTVTVDNCCGEVEMLRQENAKLLKSEQAYHERNEALEKELAIRQRDNGKLISSLRPFYKAYAAASEDAQRIMDEMPLTFDEWAISYIAQHEAMRKELESAEDTIRVLKKRAADALSEGE